MKKFTNKLYRFSYKFHIYGGLYCSIYLIIIGISAFLFNHINLVDNNPVLKCKSSIKVEIPALNNFEDTVSFVNKKLNIFGSHPQWTDYRDSANNIHYKINRPGKMYLFCMYNNDSITLEEYNYGFFSTLCGLHVMSSIEPTNLISLSWRIYAESSAIISFFVIIISIWFWFKKSLKESWQWFITIIAALASLYFILNIWLVG